jgi:hypothetical protein
MKSAEESWEEQGKSGVAEKWALSQSSGRGVRSAILRGGKAHSTRSLALLLAKKPPQPLY